MMLKTFFGVCLIAFSGLVLQLSAEASGSLKQATRLSGFPDLSEQYTDDNFRYQYKSYFVMDERTILYAKIVENTSISRDSGHSAVSMNVYAFDVSTSTSVLLFGQKIVAPTELFTGYNPPVQFEKINSGVMVAVLGSLFRTDGSPAGSVKLLNYGIRYAGSADPTNMPRLKIVGKSNDLVYLNIDEEIGPVYASPKKRLWRSDGTPTGTYPISMEHFIKDAELWGVEIRFAFTARIDGQNWVYYTLYSEYEDSQLWRTRDSRGNTESEFVYSGSYRTLESVVRLDGMLFSCDRTSFPEARLNRFANDGSISTIAIDCDYQTLARLDGALYYLSSDGQLWKSFGSALSTTSIFKFDDRENTRYSLCSTNDSLFYLGFRYSDDENPQRLYQIRRGGQVTESGLDIGIDERTTANNSSRSRQWSVKACGQTGLLLEREIVSFYDRSIDGESQSERVIKTERLFVDAKTGQASRVVGGSGFAKIDINEVVRGNLEMIEYIAHPIFMRKYVPPMAPIIMDLLD